MKNNKRDIKYYLYLLPFLIFSIIFLFYPLSQAFYYVFIEWDGFGEKEFVGLQNFTRMINDRRFFEALVANLVYVFFFSIVPAVIGLVLASLIGRKRVFGLGVFRTALLVPLAMTSAAIGIVFYTIFSPSGLINELLRLFGFTSRVAWLGATTSARLAIGMVGTWAILGFATTLFISSIQKIPASLFEIADLEGANNFQKLRYIVFPFLRPTIIFVILFSTVGALGTTAFGIVSALTQGAYYTRPLAQYGHEVAFVQFEVGYGASIIFIPALLGLFLSYIIYRGE